MLIHFRFSNFFSIKIFFAMVGHAMLFTQRHKLLWSRWKIVYASFFADRKMKQLLVVLTQTHRTLVRLSSSRRWREVAECSNVSCIFSAHLFTSNVHVSIGTLSSYRLLFVDGTRRCHTQMVSIEKPRIIVAFGKFNWKRKMHRTKSKIRCFFFLVMKF